MAAAAGSTPPVPTPVPMNQENLLVSPQGVPVAPARPSAPAAARGWHGHALSPVRQVPGASVEGAGLVAQTVTIPLKKFTYDNLGWALSGLGRSPILHERVVKPMSILGYGVSKLFEQGGRAGEALVDLLVNETTGAVVTDIFEVTTTSALQATSTVQGSLLRSAGWAASWIPGVGVITKGLLGKVAEAGELNISSAEVSVKAARAGIVDTALGVLIPCVNKLLKAPLSLMRMGGEYFAGGWQAISDNPSMARMYVTEAGDLLRGSAWKLEQVSSQFFNTIAEQTATAPSEAVRGREGEKPRLQLTLDEFKKLTHEEKQSLLFLIHDAGSLSISDAQKRAQKRLLERYKSQGGNTFDRELQAIVKSYNSLTAKEASKLTPLQYQRLEVGQKQRLVQVIREKARLNSAERNLLRNYDAVSQEEVAELVAKKFNTLSPKSRAMVLDFSSGEIDKMTTEERRALIDYLIAKIHKNTKEKGKVGRQKHIAQLNLLKAAYGARDGKKIANCFQKYLSGKEKLTMRKLLDEKVEVISMTKEQLSEATARIEASIQQKTARIQQAGGQADQQEIQEALELIESLASLKSAAQSFEAPQEQAQVPAALAGQNSRIQNVARNTRNQQRALDERVGPQVRTEGLITRGADLVGRGVGIAVEYTGVIGVGAGLAAAGVVSMPVVGAASAAAALVGGGALGGLLFHGAGSLADTTAVKYLVLRSMVVTGVAIEQVEYLASAWGLATGGLGVFNWLFGTQATLGFGEENMRWAAAKVQQISQATLQGIIEAEKYGLGLLEKSIAIEKSVWSNVMQPFVDFVRGAQQVETLASTAKGKYLKAHFDEVVGKAITECPQGVVADSSYFQGLKATTKYDTIFAQLKREMPGKEGSAEFIQKLEERLKSSYESLRTYITQAISTPHLPGPSVALPSALAPEAFNIERYVLNLPELKDKIAQVLVQTKDVLYKEHYTELMKDLQEKANRLGITAAQFQENMRPHFQYSAVYDEIAGLFKPGSAEFFQQLEYKLKSNYEYVNRAISNVVRIPYGEKMVGDSFDIGKYITNLPRLSKLIDLQKIFDTRVNEVFAVYKQIMPENVVQALLADMDFTKITSEVARQFPFMDRKSEQFYQLIGEKIQARFMEFTEKVATYIPYQTFLGSESFGRLVGKGQAIPAPSSGMPIPAFPERLGEAVAIIRQVQEKQNQLVAAKRAVEEFGRQNTFLNSILRRNISPDALENFQRQLVAKAGELFATFQAAYQVHEASLTLAQTQLGLVDFEGMRQRVEGQRVIADKLAQDKGVFGYLAYAGSSVLQVGSTGLDFASGMLVARVGAKIAARALQRTAKPLSDNLGSCLKGLSGGVRGLGRVAGGFAHAGIYGLGYTAQKIYNVFHERVLGPSIDQARLDGFKNLPATEQQHIRYLVFNSEKSVGLREKLMAILQKREPIAEGEIERFLQTAPLTDAERAAIDREVLLAYDKLDLDEKLVLSPTRFSQFDEYSQNKVIYLLQKYDETFTPALRANRVEIVRRFNALSAQKKAELSAPTIEEFRALAPEDQDTLLYRATFSQGYVAAYPEIFRGLSPDETLLKQFAMYHKMRNQGIDSRELKRLLSLLPQLTDSESTQLTPRELKDIGNEKINKLREIIGSRGGRQLDISRIIKNAFQGKSEFLKNLDPGQRNFLKSIPALLKSLDDQRELPVLERGHEEAFVILAALFNKLEIEQKNFLTGFSKEEFTALIPSEKVAMIDWIVKNDLSLTLQEKQKIVSGQPEQQDLIVLKFSKLPVPLQAQYRVQQDARKEELSIIKCEIEASIKQEDKAIVYFERKMNLLKARLSPLKLQLELEKQEKGPAHRDIKEMEEGLAKLERDMARLEAQKFQRETNKTKYHQLLQNITRGQVVDRRGLAALEPSEEELVEEISSNNPERIAAIETIAKITPEAMPACIVALQEKMSTLRQQLLAAPEEIKPQIEEDLLKTKQDLVLYKAVAKKVPPALPVAPLAAALQPATPVSAAAAMPLPMPQPAAQPAAAVAAVVQPTGPAAGQPAAPVTPRVISAEPAAPIQPAVVSVEPAAPVVVARPAVQQEAPAKAAELQPAAPSPLTPVEPAAPVAAPARVEAPAQPVAPEKPPELPRAPVPSQAAAKPLTWGEWFGKITWPQFFGWFLTIGRWKPTPKE